MVSIDPPWKPMNIAPRNGDRIIGYSNAEQYKGSYQTRWMIREGVWEGAERYKWIAWFHWEEYIKLKTAVSTDGFVGINPPDPEKFNY